MKNKFSVCKISLIACSFPLVGLASCGGGGSPHSTADGKAIIYIATYNGGVGYEWINTICNMFNEQFAEYTDPQLEEKGLKGEIIARFSMKVVFSKQSPLANELSLTPALLSEYIECSYGDRFIPTLSAEEAREKAKLSMAKRVIYLSERAGLFDLLAENHQTFARCSSLTDEALKRYGLIQRECEDEKEVYKDFLVYKKDYRLSELDKDFITQLCNSRRKYIK